MNKRDIKYQIELKKYKFELEYQKDFRTIILANTALFVLILETLLKESSGTDRFSLMLVALFILALVIFSLVVYYIRSRTEFLKQMNSLFKQYISDE